MNDATTGLVGKVSGLASSVAGLDTTVNDATTGLAGKVSGGRQLDHRRQPKLVFGGKLL